MVEVQLSRGESNEVLRGADYKFDYTPMQETTTLCHLSVCMIISSSSSQIFGIYKPSSKKLLLLTAAS